MKQMENKYQAGVKVKLEDDLPDEAPHEVAGHMHMYGYDYLVFTDGFMAFVGRVVG